MQTRIIGIGNGGCNIVDDLRRSNAFNEAEPVYYAYKLDDLSRHGREHDNRILLDIEQPYDFTVTGDRVDLIIIASMLGGHTSEAFSVPITKFYKEYSKIVLGIVSLPFTAEGQSRGYMANRTLEVLKPLCDVVLIQSNQKIPGDLQIAQINKPICQPLCRAFEKFCRASAGTASELKSLLFSAVHSERIAQDCLRVE